MKAIVFDLSGRPEDVLRLTEIPPPRAKSEEVLVEVKCRPIQPADRFFIQGQYRIKPEPRQVAGLEGAGVIVEAASGSPPAGTRVAFRWPGTWAELAAIPVRRLIRIPGGTSDCRH